MLKGCPQIYFSEVRHFSRCLLVVRYQTCHQTTYTCFCTQEFFETVSLALELIGVAIIVYGAIVTIIFLIKASALTNTTAAFADSNAISGVEGIFAALMGQPVQTGRPAA
jgi:hypothetical protein